MPKVSEQFDYEGELVAVIGRTAKAVRREQALDHVAGYTIFNEGLIRDYQLRTSQWTIGKNFDRTGSFGPVWSRPTSSRRAARGSASRRA